MSAAGIAVAAALAVALPAAAAGATVPVNVQFSEFGPSQVDVLPGETVEWTNVSERRHTINADDDSFASGDLFSGDTFARRFDEVGAFPYHCSVHQGMIGEVDVRRVTLDPLPAAPVPAGDKVQFGGRTADPGDAVRIERADGAGFATVATATPAADGSWGAQVAAAVTGDYRASTNAGLSQSRRLLVSDRKILVRATPRGIAVTVTPALPYAPIVLQQDLPERFGWWPVMRARVDYVSKATFRVLRPARVRVALLDADGWTALVTSPVLMLGRTGRRAGPSNSERGDRRRVPLGLGVSR
jgi:plastocyanin